MLQMLHPITFHACTAKIHVRRDQKSCQKRVIGLTLRQRDKVQWKSFRFCNSFNGSCRCCCCRCEDVHLQFNLWHFGSSILPFFCFFLFVLYLIDLIDQLSQRFFSIFVVTVIVVCCCCCSTLIWIWSIVVHSCCSNTVCVSHKLTIKR